MSLQQPGPGESFATNLALVCEDVHLQGRGRHIQFVAALGRVCGKLLVGLFVSGQVGAGDKVFTTFIALELQDVLQLLDGVQEDEEVGEVDVHEGDEDHGEGADQRRQRVQLGLHISFSLM